MKHAGEVALRKVKPILRSLRRMEDLRESKPGIFYRAEREWLRFPVNMSFERRDLLRIVAGMLRE
jgi:hypothetical protein